MLARATDTVGDFVERLANSHFENAFNPYSESCAEHDESNAAEIRRRNLELVMRAAIAKRVDSIWIGRDLGYRGGRRTGLALTDEAHLSSHAELLGTPNLCRATKGPIVKERTATVVWETLKTIGRPVFLWNVFPFHPHVAGDPMSNRGHTPIERRACKPFLTWLFDMFQPHIVVAIGRDAYFALEDLGIRSAAIRHPSYGGQTEFIDGLYRLYGITPPQRS